MINQSILTSQYEEQKIYISNLIQVIDLQESNTGIFQLGRSIQWYFQYERMPFYIKLKRSVITDKKKIFMNGKLIYDKKNQKKQFQLWVGSILLQIFYEENLRNYDLYFNTVSFKALKLYQNELKIQKQKIQILNEIQQEKTNFLQKEITDIRNTLNSFIKSQQNHTVELKKFQNKDHPCLMKRLESCIQLTQDENTIFDLMTLKNEIDDAPEIKQKQYLQKQSMYDYPILEDETKISMNKNDPQTHALIPCGHRYYCSQCAKLIISSKQSCPYCRQIVINCIAIYQ